MATDDDQELEDWVDDRMATLEPNERPDVDAGLDVLQDRQTRRTPSIGAWMVLGAAVLWAGVMLVTVGPLAPQPTPEASLSLAEGPANDRFAPAAPPPVAAERTAPTHAGIFAVADRTPAPDFSLPDAEGDTATMADYDGRVLLLNFWATWCQPCKAEMPWFVAFEDVLSSQGFSVLGVSVDQPGWDIVRPFLEERPVNYRIALADTAERSAPFGPMTILPTTWLIDREGRIASEHIGLVDRELLESEIRQLLAE